MMNWRKIENKRLRAKGVKLVKNTWANIDGDAVSIYSRIKGRKKVWVVEFFELNLKSYFKGFPIKKTKEGRKETRVFRGKNAKPVALETINSIIREG